MNDKINLANNELGYLLGSIKKICIKKFNKLTWTEKRYVKRI